MAEASVVMRTAEGRGSRRGGRDLEGRLRRVYACWRLQGAKARNALGGTLSAGRAETDRRRLGRQQQREPGRWDPHAARGCVCERGVFLGARRGEVRWVGVEEERAQARGAGRAGGLGRRLAGAGAAAVGGCRGAGEVRTGAGALALAAIRSGRAGGGQEQGEGARTQRATVCLTRA